MIIFNSEEIFMKYKVEIFWHEPDEEFVARVVDVPKLKYLSGMAKTRQEALKLLEEVVNEAIEIFAEKGIPLSDKLHEPIQ
jgi:predicted RNase H-like HicB family nuclease